MFGLDDFNNNLKAAELCLDRCIEITTQHNSIVCVDWEAVDYCEWVCHDLE